jgi:hypothetical protein
MGMGSLDRERAAVVTSVSTARLSLHPIALPSVRALYSKLISKEFRMRSVPCR